MTALGLVTPDILRRQVLVALAAQDPFTGRLVSDGLDVTANGLHRAPVVNLSGYFVWRDEGPATPASFTLTPASAAYQAMTVPAPFLPAPGMPGNRLVRAVLQPTAAYPFPDDAVVVRGRLIQTAGGAALTGARLRLQWKDDNNLWNDGAAAFVTGADGRFAVGLTAPIGAQPTTASPPFRVRLAADWNGVTRVTVEADMPPGSQALPPGAAPPSGEVAWDTLLPP